MLDPCYPDLAVIVPSGWVHRPKSATLCHDAQMEGFNWLQNQMIASPIKMFFTFPNKNKFLDILVPTSMGSPHTFVNMFSTKRMIFFIFHVQYSSSLSLLTIGERRELRLSCKSCYVDRNRLNEATIF